VLLGTKRIGHGFAVVKYPNILKIVKKMKIGIEVNPISNQVLKLVDDLRNHPAAVLFSDDYPVVISRFVAHIFLHCTLTKLMEIHFF
jgi:adenosine deaminase CECR1